MLERFDNKWPEGYLAKELVYTNKELREFRESPTEENREKVLKLRTEFYLKWINGVFE